jgi:hypothetical protein
MRSLLKIVLGVFIASMLLLGLAWIFRIAPGAPIVAIPLGVLILLFGVRSFRRVADAPPLPRLEAEDVAELDVFFVCGECGTEFRVEKIAELQVPRHCGEPMFVERRPRTAPGLN